MMSLPPAPRGSQGHRTWSLLISQPSSPYRAKADRIAGAERGYLLHHAVGELADVLAGLLRDADAGLIVSIADQIRAEVFDDFLDHAEHYVQLERKNEAGVIAGVVFEDSIRGMCCKRAIVKKGVKLDALISALANAGTLSPVKAKRARAAADVRTKATHAQWDEFELSDVQAAIVFTRELIEGAFADA